MTEHSECPRFLELIGNRTEFVVKPASGAAGRGIVVVAGRLGNNFFSTSGRLIEWTDCVIICRRFCRVCIRWVVNSIKSSLSAAS